ncbi:MAG: glutathione S-transferase family protein [Rhizobiales bacterium]|nr:glutathione S-transferase family protein [Hyphomicrobiales bacterium]
MLILDTYQGAFNEPSASAFCIKAMCLLEMSNLEWKPKYISNPSKAPKQKLPVLHDGANTIADSEFIRTHLEEKYKIDFDSHLTSEQRAMSRMIIRALDEHFYFLVVSARWMNEESWQYLKQLFFGKLPFPVKLFVPNIVRKSVIKMLHAQGIGRHTTQEQLVRAKQDIDAIAELLGDNNFLFGENPSAADASVIPMLRAALCLSPRQEVSTYIEKNKTLLAYLERGKEQLYPKL